MLERHPHLEGVLVDRPAAIARVAPARAAHGERCALVGGDFFDSVPAGGDAYLLSHVIHDWDEGRCLSIVQLRRAIAPDRAAAAGRDADPTGRCAHPAKVLDMIMLVTGGQERTEAQYAELLGRADFGLT